ncbi:uncharacterized protein LOC105696643 [Orussus abietinus]|uniref:uncharacterized protein LOC105696643 n=1 Tax=Orussus abietinus TaxID=222816 RepID=UPI000C716242|nr:uncharacterized protein LOC105696643 [Orussus abietinus]
MAAAESKPENGSRETAAKCDNSRADSRANKDCYEFRLLDALFYIFSIGTFLADLVTGGLVVAYYFASGHTSWAYFTLDLMLVPAIIIQLFSLRWHQTDGSLKISHWVSHVLIMGTVQRYLMLLCAAIKYLLSKHSTIDKNWVQRQHSDICMLHLFESFVKAAPQLLLQLYIMSILQFIPLWTSLSAASSLCSLAWAVASYTKAMYSVHSSECKVIWPALALQVLWRSGMLASRVAALVVAAICLGRWFFLFIGGNWMCMTAWVILQKTNFCPTVWEERVYNGVIGAIYCFEFFNLREGHSRYRILAFYSITVAQNTVFLTAYAVHPSRGTPRTDVLIAAGSLIIGGTLLGLGSMLLYYGKFHATGRSRSCRNLKTDPELAPRGALEKTGTLRSLKGQWHGSVVDLPSVVAGSHGIALSEEVTADKKSLLTNIVQNTEFVEEGIVNSSCDLVDEVDVPGQTGKHAELVEGSERLSPRACQLKVDAAVEEASPEDDYVDCDNPETLLRQKRRGICLPVELGLETYDSASGDPNSSLRSQKRRGICSSAQLGLELVTDEDNYVERSFRSFERRKPLLDAVSELELKLRDLQDEGGSSVGADVDDEENKGDARFPEGTVDPIAEAIKDRERLNTPATSEKSTDKEKPSREEMSQKEETMSHVTSVHDYENVCPLGIARPPWCIRSWKGYTDIETYIHDDSVVRDRRRDTLTSSATGTTFSSEFSEATCTSPPAPRRAAKRSRQDDYLDTLLYDLVDWEASAAINGDSIRPGEVEVEIETEQEANLFVARPVVIDEKGGMFSLDTILEEREDSNANANADQANGFDPTLASGCPISTLVATIDEIRRCAAENSPRHVYHRTESQWEDLDPRVLLRKAHLTKVLFAGDSGEAIARRSGFLGPGVPVLRDGRSTGRNEDRLDVVREMARCRSTGSAGRTPLINAILSDSPVLGPRAKVQKYRAERPSENRTSSLNEHVYSEVTSLGAERLAGEGARMAPRRSSFGSESSGSSSPSPGYGTDPRDPEERTEALVEGNRTRSPLLGAEGGPGSEDLRESHFTAPETALQLRLPAHSAGAFAASGEKRRAIATTIGTATTSNRPRRKFSLLRERFEPRSERRVYAVNPKSHLPRSEANPPAGAHDKENWTPAVVSRIDSWNSFIRDRNGLGDKDKETPALDESTGLKERRSIFLKEVLSPTKFQTWGKKRTFSPNAKLVPKA